MIIVIGYFVRNKLTRTSYLPVQTVYGCTPWGQIIKQCGLEKESYKAALNSLHLTIHLMDEWGTSTWSSSWVFLLFLCKIMQITHLYMPHKWSEMHRLVPASQLQQSCRGGGGDVWWWFFWGRFGWGWRLKLHTKKTSVDLQFLFEPIIKLSFLNVNLVLRQIDVLELLPFFKYFVSICALLKLTEAFED